MMQRTTFFRHIALSSLFAVLSTQAPVLPRDLPSGPQMVLAENFPDPGLIEHNGAYFAFGTTNGKANVPVAFSQDFASWEVKPIDALQDLPEWTSGGIWAPSVTQLAPDSYVMYFSGGSKEDESKHCIGTATSKTVFGPFDAQATPFACPLKLGGAIDAAGFTDTDGSHWVVYKLDGNSLGGGGTCGNGDGSHSTAIMLQQVADDGFTLIGAPTPILDRSDSDGPLIEAPSLAKSSEGVYFLSFSSNCYNGPLYDISYATSTTGVQGPYTKSREALLLPSDKMLSPGGATLAPDLSRMVFHADEKYSDPGVRQMWTAPLTASGTSLSMTLDTTSTS